MRGGLHLDWKLCIEHNSSTTWKTIPVFNPIRIVPNHCGELHEKHESIEQNKRQLSVEHSMKLK